MRLARDLGPQHLGRRVVVRRALADGSAGDVLGELVAWGPDRLAVRARDGRDVLVEHGAVLAGKPVPPPPARRGAPEPDPGRVRADLALERAAAQGWPPLEREELGGWLLRASAGFTGRGNAVLPLGDPGLPLDAALERVVAWYAARGLVPRFQVPLPAARGLDADLLARGWQAYHPTLVLTAATADVLAQVPDPGVAVEAAGRPAEGWLAAYHYRGAPLPPAARAVLEGGEQRAFLQVPDPDGGPPLGIARVAVADGWAGLTAVEVAERARGRGLARALLRAGCAWGAARGASGTYLQVAEDNGPALALYAGAGFAVHHRYRYLRPGDPVPVAP
ncbi:GNAT family N-acetyltransferase [Vallicoccus soli]|uniref:GNAT family N-acetyltransferase n=1 Tax=Vallicoccus soli TaxID=2339232 RepID=A0A3A3Z5Z9_9ACTN|nr:GNAT family N-acetyltransferase [Vallicoccus soli]